MSLFLSSYTKYTQSCKNVKHGLSTTHMQCLYQLKTWYVYKLPSLDSTKCRAEIRGCKFSDTNATEPLFEETVFCWESFLCSWDAAMELGLLSVARLGASWLFAGPLDDGDNTLLLAVWDD